jgi:hypothetical protein
MTGFAWTRRGCSPYRGIHGEVLQNIDKRVFVSPVANPARVSEAPEGLGRDDFGTILHMVTWGELEYLVRESRMLAFCNTINAGLPPDCSCGTLAAHAARSYPLKQESHALVRELSEDPLLATLSVHASWNDMILKWPVVGQVLEASRVSSVDEPRRGRILHTQRVLINQGADQGLRPGMLMYRNALGGRCVVSEVLPTRAWIRYECSAAREEEVDVVAEGDALSSCYPR